MEDRQFIPRKRLNRLDIPVVNRIPNSKEEEIPLQEIPTKERPHDYSGFIILRLSPEVPLPSKNSNTLFDVARELRLQGLERLLEQFDLSTTRYLIGSMKREEILEFERTAAKSELPPLHSLTAYWRIDVRDRVEQILEIVKRLNGLKEVDFAYQEFAASDPQVNPGDDPYNSSQDYLDAAPEGIDARWAWTQPNGQGAGIGFVDLEQGWFPNHEDFTSKSPTLVYGDNRDGVGTYRGNHGTAVLGEVIADDNTLGVVGIAPSVNSVRMTSHYNAGTNTSGNVADAILGVLPTMNPGDVLLLEVQRSFLPTEMDDADFDAIRLAVALGIVVVEAAGNGSRNLDTYANTLGDNILIRGSIDFRESGAILV